MSKSSSSSSSGGIGIVGLLGVAFVVLKLTEVIDWAWIWVLVPFWGGFICVGIVVMVVFIMAIIMALLGKS